MVIPLIMRGVGMAGRGIGAGIKGVGRAAGNIGGKVQQGWEGAQNFYGGAKSSIQKMPGAAKVAAGKVVAGAGLMTGVAGGIIGGAAAGGRNVIDAGRRNGARSEEHTAELQS